MKFSLFNPWPVYGVERREQWPVPPVLSTVEGTRDGMERGIRISRVADEAGFDYVTLAEHHYEPRQLSPNPLVSAAALSQHLTRAGIAVLGCTLPLVNPIRAAEEIAVLDAMTSGKLLIGLFRGTPNEYLTYGTNPGETREMFEEAVDLVQHAWTEPEPFAWVGRHYDYRLVSVWPRPVTRPHPPILVSAGSPSSAAYAARKRFRMGIAFAPAPVAATLVDLYRTGAASHGWTPGEDDVLYRGIIALAETDAKAEELAQRHSVGRLRQAFDFGVGAELAKAMGGGSGGAGPTKPSGPPRLPFVGSPDTVARQITEFAERTGVGHFDLLFNDFAMRFEDALNGARLFGAEVLPQLTRVRTAA